MLNPIKSILTVRQIQALDRWAIEKVGIPSLCLMENAGRGIAGEISRRLKGRKKARIIIICGTGNNGGDGLVAARYLSYFGFDPQIYLVGPYAQLKTDALVNYRIARRLKIPFLKSLASADIIVDALFGVGLNRPLKAPYDGIIKAVNSQKAYVLAVDIPSGLDGTTGKIYEACVKADLTVTFSYAKSGFFKKEGPRFTGRVKVIDIGIPSKAVISSR